MTTITDRPGIRKRKAPSFAVFLIISVTLTFILAASCLCWAVALKFNISFLQAVELTYKSFIDGLMSGFSTKPK